MTLPLYLAAAHYPCNQASRLPCSAAYMACRFSPSGPGLTNIPAYLPPGSALMLNDQLPPRFSDPSQILRDLTRISEKIASPALILDFQRPGNPKTAEIAAFLAQNFPGPVLVSPLYIQNLTCGIFLPSPPLHIPLDQYLHPWSGRKIWLEIYPDQEQLTLTKSGCTAQPLFHISGTFPYEDPMLFCSYRIETDREQARFLLSRNSRQALAMLRAAQGVSGAVGMEWELGDAIKECLRDSSET